MLLFGEKNGGPVTIGARLRALSERDIIRLATFVMFAYSLWLASNRTWNPNYVFWPNSFGAHYYVDQANAILHGRLNVRYFWLGNECFRRDGNCYGYFGIFPSIIRLPLVALRGSSAPILIPLSMAAAAGISMWSSLSILQRTMTKSFRDAFNDEDRSLLLGFGAILLGVGSAFTLVSQSTLYREAIIWMAALVLFAIAMSLRWIDSGNRRYLVITLIAATGATNSRPTAIPAIVLLGLWLWLHDTRTSERRVLRFDSIPFTIAWFPAASCLAVTYMKFGQFSLPWHSWDNFVVVKDYYRLNNGQIQGARFVPSNLVQYLRPDSVAYSLSKPWAQALVPKKTPPIFLPPVPRGGIQVDETVSVTNTMPIQLILTVISAVQLGRLAIKRKIRALPDSALPLLLITAAGSVGPLTLMGSTSRYLGDFMPSLACGTIFGGLYICERLQSRGTLRKYLLVALPVAIYFSLVMYWLNVNSFASQA